MPKPLPSQEILREKLDYDPESGILTWAYGKPGISKGTAAGNVCGTRSGSVIGIDGSIYRSHRIIWKWMTGEDPPTDIDHVNQDRFDNRWENLRLATPGENINNRKGWGKYKKGVRKARNRFGAQLRKDGKYIYLGTFDTEDEAHQAYCEAAKRIHGLFACVESKVSSKIAD